MRPQKLLVLALACASPSQGARAQGYSWARDVTVVFPPLTAIAPAFLHGSAGDWNGDGIPDIGIGFAGGGLATPGRMRIYSGFDFSVAAEWVGSLLPPPYSGGEWPGRGADFADVDGDGMPDLLMGNAEAFLGSSGFVGKVDAISHA